MVTQVIDQTPRVQFVAAAAQTIFAYPFLIFVKTDITVDVNGTPLTVDVGFTVDGVGNINGGNVTLTAGSTAGDIVTIFRSQNFDRETDYQESGDFLSKTVNNDHNRHILMTQQNREELSRTLQYAVNDIVGTTSLPVLANRKSQVLGFDSSGNPIAVSNGTEILPDGTLRALVDFSISAAATSHPTATTGFVIESNYFDSNRISGSGALYSFTGTTTAGKSGNWPDADGFFYDTDGKKFETQGVNSEVNFGQFGALGNGTTDDTVAIKATIAFCLANLRDPLFESLFTIRGSGTFLISSKIDLTRINIKLDGGKFLFANNVTDNPMIFGHLLAGNDAANCWKQFSVDGNKLNQITPDLVAVQIENCNWTGAFWNITCDSCDIGLRIFGNVENQLITVAGSNCTLLVSEQADGANTPDEIIYTISANSCDQYFISESNSACKVIFNIEAQTIGITEFPIKILGSQKAYTLSGTIRTMDFGCIFADAPGSGALILDNLSIFGVENNWAINCRMGSLVGTANIETAKGGGVWLRGAQASGSPVMLHVNGFQNNPALKLGDNANGFRVDSAYIILCAGNPFGATDLELVVDNVLGGHVEIPLMSRGIEFLDSTSGTGLFIRCDRKLITSDLPITVGTSDIVGEVAGIEVVGSFNPTQLNAYSTPFTGLSVTSFKGSGGNATPAYFTGAAWSFFTQTAIP